MVSVGNVVIVFHCVQIRSGCLTLISNFIPFHSPPGFALIFFSFPSSLCLSLAFSAFPLVVLYFLKNCRNFLFLSCHLVSLHSGFPARSLPLELCSRYMPFQAHKFSRSSCYNSGFCLENAISKSIRMIVVWIQGI